MLKVPKGNTGIYLGLDELRAMRREAGLRIDPETAEVYWAFAYITDPYGDGLPLAPEEEQIGRAYFARMPGSDVWVWFGNLPADTRQRLYEIRRARWADVDTHPDF